MGEPRYFEKHGNRVVLELEAVKSGVASRVGNSTGLFRVPEVLFSDGETLRLQYVEGLTPLSALIDRRDPRMRDLMHATGRAIAAVHREAGVPDQYAVHLIPTWEETSATTFIHGDLTADNVCVDAGGSVVLLDWAAAPALGYAASVGDPMFDVVWFLAHVCRAPSARRLHLPEFALLDAFLGGYIGERPSSLTTRAFSSVRSALAPAYAAEVSRAATLRRASRWGFVLVQAARRAMWMRYRPALPV